LTSKLNSCEKLLDQANCAKDRMEQMLENALSGSQYGNSNVNQVDMLKLESSLQRSENECRNFKQQVEGLTVSCNVLKQQLKVNGKNMDARNEGKNSDTRNLDEKTQINDELLNSEEISRLKQANFELKNQLKTVSKPPTPTKSVAFYDEVEQTRKLNDALQHISELKMDKERMNEKVNNVQYSLEQTRRDKTSVEGHHQQELKTLKNTYKNITTEKIELEDRLNRLGLIQNQLQQANEISQTEYQQEVTRLQTNLSDLTSRVQETSHRLQESQARNSEYQRQIRNFGQKDLEIMSLEQEKELLNGKFIEMINDCRQLRGEKLNVEETFAKSRINLISLQSENHQLRANYDAATAKSNSKAQNFNNFEQVLHTAVNERVKLEVQIKGLQNQYEFKITQLQMEYDTRILEHNQGVQKKLEEVAAQQQEIDDRNRKLSESEMLVENKRKLAETKLAESFKIGRQQATVSKIISVDTTSEEMNSLKSEINHLKSKVEELKTHENKVHELTSELDALKGEMEANKMSFDSQSRSTTPTGGSRQLCRQLEVLVVEKQRLTRDLESLKKEVNKNRERELDYDDMRQKYIEAVSSKTKLHSNLESARNEKMTIVEEKRRLESRASEFEELLKFSKNERDQLNYRNDELTDELAQIKEQLAGEYGDRSAVIMELNNRIDELSEEKGRLQDKCKAAESESATGELVTRLTEVLAEKDELEEQLVRMEMDLEKSVQKCQENDKRAKNDVSGEEKNNKSINKIRKLESARDSLQKEYNLILDNKTRMDSEIAFLSTQLEEAREHLEDAKLREKQAKIKTEEANSKFFEAESRLLESESRLRDAENQLSVTVSQLTDTENKLNDVENRLNDTESQLNHTEERLNEAEVRLNSQNAETPVDLGSINQHALMCELDDLKDQLETEARLRTDAETRLRESKNSENEAKNSENDSDLKQELEETHQFMSNFEKALLTELSSSASDIVIPEIPQNCSSAERLQYAISAYFEHQENLKVELNELKEAKYDYLEEASKGGRGSPASIGKPSNRARNANSTASGVDSSVKQTNKKSKIPEPVLKSSSNEQTGDSWSKW